MMVGTIGELRRFPVKSLLGETLTGAVVQPRGLAGDRRWAVRGADGRFGSGKSTRRFRQMDGLFQLTARYDGAVPVLGFPSGVSVRGDDPAVHAALSRHIGEPVTLTAEEDVSHFDEGPLHVLTTASLRHLAALLGGPVDPRRFRANIVIDVPGVSALLEDGWLGQALHVGDEVVLRVAKRMPRCVMVNNAQQELPHDGRILRAVAAANELTFGVLAHVERAGAVRCGDPVVRRG
ncbi:MOSC domain-containing protein [Catellatospora vulcania]|uniref:MOSC domain-containing protein n=1 Tax=Catellatospora vulcania TaxID=1460450 RepID=UPI001E3C6424|nr:MOSC domain-containing protein [Catellatospora vulcania]